MQAEIDARILLRLALSVGKSDCLPTMLEIMLTELLQVSSGTGALVVQRHPDAEPERQWTIEQALPYSLPDLATYSEYAGITRLDRVWTQVEQADWHEYVRFMDGGICVHAFRLPDFGLLLLFTRKAPLSDLFCDAFRAISTSLAHACFACLPPADLARWMEFERLLMHWSLRFMTLEAARVPATIDVALAEMGEFVGADRTYIIAYDFAAGDCSNIHEWCAAGIAPQIDELQHVPLAGLDAWLTAHRNGEIYQVPLVQALDPEDPLRAILEPQGIRTLVTIPLMDTSGCFAFLGFDAVRQARNWDRIDTTTLKMMADIFANALVKRRQHLQLQEIQRQLVESSREAQAQAQRADAANEAKSRFLAMMSHDIRTPLTAMLGMNELLADTTLNATQARYVQTIGRAGDTLRAILGDILDFSAMESDGFRLQMEPLDLPGTLADAVELLHSRAAERGNRLLVQIDEAVPRGVLADRARISQLLWNLLSNSIKYTEGGDISLRARLERWEDRVAWVTISVADTGAGIPEEQLTRIFEPFTKVVRDSVKQAGGTGLGLAIVRRLVDAIGGDVSIRSQEGVGTVVTLSLPFMRASLVPAAAVQDQDADRQPLRVDRLASKPHVLLAEDDPDVREAAAETLVLLGCDVTEASNGQAAVQACARERFDVVLMDCRMPVMDGFAATREIRRQEGAGRRTPIVALTAALMEHERQAAVAAGMDDILPKPYRRSLLKGMLDRWIDARGSVGPAPGERGAELPRAGGLLP